MNAQQAFNRLVSKDFREASREDVKAVALAVWHESFVPDTSALNLESARAASYVLDRLMRFNCVSKEERQKLLEALASVTRRFGLKEMAVTTRDRSVDKSARKWGLDSDLRLLLHDMLPYQTRHYRHTN